jgi:ubiquitin-protein ligase
VSLKSTPGGGDSLTKLTGFVEGPRDTPYEGGYFVVDIELGE